jgi:hypothetical protein
VVPGAGHWLMEESPAFTIALVQDFLKDRLPATSQPVRSGDIVRPSGAKYGLSSHCPSLSEIHSLRGTRPRPVLGG